MIFQSSLTKTTSMQLFDLSKELILLILEELDSATLLQFCKASREIHSTVMVYDPLRYQLELGMAGMKDGALSSHPTSLRLQQLLGYKDDWPKLSWAHEDTLQIATPAVMGVSGGFFYHVSQDNAGSPPLWDLSLYELRSFRTSRMALPLRHYKYRCNFEIQRITIDSLQGLMVLLEFHQSPITSAISARLHFRDLWTCEHHAQALTERFDLNTDWWGDLSSAGHAIWSKQFEICGRWVGISMCYEAEEGEGTTEIALVDWKESKVVRCYEDQAMSFQLLDESHILLASQLDDDTDTDSDNYGHTDTRASMVDHMTTSSPPEDAPLRRPPSLILCRIGSSALTRKNMYDLPHAWIGTIASMDILYNSSPTHDDETRIPQDTLFFPDPAARITVISIEFCAERIPQGSDQHILLILDESFFVQLSAPGLEDTPVSWDTWRAARLERSLLPGAHTLKLAGHRLVFLETPPPPARPGQARVPDRRSRVRLIDFSPHAIECIRSGTVQQQPPWMWFGRWTTVTAVLPDRVRPYIRTSTVDMQDMTWFNATQDNLVLFDEYENTTFVRVLTFGHVPQEMDLLSWAIADPGDGQ